MPSGYKIRWSETAATRLNEIYDYLEHCWTSREIKNFSIQLERSLKISANQPETFPSSKYFGGARKCVVNRHQSLFYIVQNNYVIIITLHDHRMKA